MKTNVGMLIKNLSNIKVAEHIKIYKVSSNISLSKYIIKYETLQTFRCGFLGGS